MLCLGVVNRCLSDTLEGTVVVLIVVVVIVLSLLVATDPILFSWCP